MRTTFQNFYNLLEALETFTTALPQVSLEPKAFNPSGTDSRPLKIVK